jgi:pimeloyl-ACP methyl ester carboxylesterase
VGTRVLDVCAGAESLFFLCVYLPRRWILNQPAPPYSPLPTRDQRRKAFLKLWKATPDPGAYVSLWFQGVPIEAIGREDVKDWLVWNLWNKPHHTLIDERELEEYLVYTEKVLSHRFVDGHTGNVSTSVTFDPVRMMHRPLIWYILIVGFADRQMFITMFWYGYTFHRLPLTKYFSSFPPRPLSIYTRCTSPANFSYWSLPHTSTSHTPMLFLHAIGVGYHFYLPFMREMRDYHHRTGCGIICLEIPAISSRISPPYPHGSELTNEVAKILAHHNWTSFMVISHSYGSVACTHLLRDPAVEPMIRHLLFVDPVAFSFHDPHIAWNFLRRKPRTASQIQLQYFASMDPDIAYTLTRRFIWPENSLWREDVEERYRELKGRCTVALSGGDIIVDSWTVGKYLTRDTTEDGEVSWYEQEDRFEDEWKGWKWTGQKRLEVLWFEGLNHAEIFDTEKDRARLWEVIEDYTKDGVEINGASAGPEAVTVL